jgi:hypothetical protein
MWRPKLRALLAADWPAPHADLFGRTPLPVAGCGPGRWVASWPCRSAPSRLLASGSSGKLSPPAATPSSTELSAAGYSRYAAADAPATLHRPVRAAEQAEVHEEYLASAGGRALAPEPLAQAWNWASESAAE